jgi:hypothetical protein
MSKVRVRVLFAVLTIVLLGVAQNLPAQLRGPSDPGVRGEQREQAACSPA